MPNFPSMDQVMEAGEGDALTQGAILIEVPWGISPPPVSIVLTNPCDLENDKASFLLVAACKPAREVFRRSKEYLSLVGSAEQPTAKQIRAVDEAASCVILNRAIGRYFAFDATPLHDEEMWLVVDFQHLLCLDYEKGCEPGEMIGKLNSPYCQQMLHSFASYTARVGVDRPDAQKHGNAVRSLTSA